LAKSGPAASGEWHVEADAAFSASDDLLRADWSWPKVVSTPTAVTPALLCGGRCLAALPIHPYIQGELGGVMSDTWTIAQAAMIIEKPSQLLQKTVERAPVKPALAQRGGKRIYVFEMRDLVFFCALDDMKDGITSNKQVELYQALKNIPRQAAIGTVGVGS
jgi:hypothetical protein